MLGVFFIKWLLVKLVVPRISEKSEKGAIKGEIIAYLNTYKQNPVKQISQSPIVLKKKYFTVDVLSGSTCTWELYYYK